MTRADPNALLSQAGNAAIHYFRVAFREIDETFGEGYAKANPELVGRFMSVAASDFAAAVQAQAMESAVGELTKEIRALVNTIKPERTGGT